MTPAKPLSDRKSTPRTLSRRRCLRALGCAAATVIAAPFFNLNRYQVFANTAREYSERTVRLIRENLVIDMLGLLSLNRGIQRKWASDAKSFSEEEFRMLRLSGINVFHDARPGVRSLPPGTPRYEGAVQFLADENAFIAGNDERLMRIDDRHDLQRVHGSGKIGVLMGIQDASHFRFPDDVDLFHSLGQRVSQLTYNSRNLIGTGSTERNDSGISDFGVSIIERMNKVGMAVDVSHCGEQTTLEALEISKKPVLITHANVRALAGGNPRTKTDAAILVLKKSGGVMGISCVRNFVKATEPTTIEDMLDHYDYVKKLIGPEFIGVGSDIDLYGYDALPADQLQQLRGFYKESYGFRAKLDIEEVAHPQRMYSLVEGLIRRRYSDSEIKGTIGGNFPRALTEIWDVGGGAPT